MKGTKYYLYVLRCSDNSLYCGITNDMKRRYEEHAIGSPKAAKYTRGRRPLELVHIEPCRSHSVALKKEYAFKRWKKTQKELYLRKKPKSRAASDMRLLF